MNKILEKIDFGNEAGDDIDNIEELVSYFVEQKQFVEYLRLNSSDTLKGHLRVCFQTAYRC